MRRRWTVVENVAEVAAALTTMHFRALFNQRVIRLRTSRIWQHVPKRRPAIAAVVFGFRTEHCKFAAGATVRSRAFLAQEWTRIRRFRAATAQNFETFRTEQRQPLRVRMGDRILLRARKRARGPAGQRERRDAAQERFAFHDRPAEGM